MSTVPTIDRVGSSGAALARGPGDPPAEGMVCIPGGTFRMGSDRHYPEEAPAHRVTADGCWMDRVPVTNDRFRQFVVVHVAYRDVEAYVGWSGKSLPTGAEWEFAARGGLDGAEYAWGDELTPDGRHLANTWQGDSPWQNQQQDGYEYTSPVDAFPANGYGVHDMIGNVWEWTSDWYRPRHPEEKVKACCIPRNPRGGSERNSHDPRDPNTRIPRKVLKGGSHLCAPNYCRRFRPTARFPEPMDTSASHVGFRCIVRVRRE